MNSEFELLSQKVERLAELAQTLRNENNELRRDVVGLRTQNQDLKQRIEQAHARVAAVLAQLPEDDLDDEEAA